MIAFLCSNCGAQLRVRDELAGTTGKCPRCKQAVEAPRPSRAPAGPVDADGEGDGGRQVFESGGGVAAEELAFLAPPEAPDELGRLGGYRVLKVLGSGGMGIVFQAEDVHLKRPVALKALRASLANKVADRKRFLREAQAVARLDHEHIVPVYQVGEDRNIPFLAMKLLQGESLEDRLGKSGGKLDFPEVLRVGRGIAEGLQAAHTAGLIHRDIKPANIWLEAGRDWVRIVDFGLARAAEEDVHLTQPGSLMGTPAYMAPEQAAAAELDQRADLFSLGCVLYRLSTGQLPFKGKNMMAVLTALATKTPKPPAQVDPSLPQSFSDLVMRLLSKKPDGRPRDADAVIAVLDKVRREMEAEAARQSADEEAEVLEVEDEEAPEELDEVEDLDEVEEPEGAGEDDGGRPRKGRRGRGGRRKKAGKEDAPVEDYWERKVMTLAVVTGVAVLLLVVFLIIRHIWKKSHDSPNGAASPPTLTAPLHAGPRAERGRRGRCREPSGTPLWRGPARLAGPTG